MAHSTAWWFLLLLSFLQPSRFTSAAQIKLRSTVIDTRHVSQRARKLMDGTVQHQPHVHEDWGVLHSMSQILVTMIPERTHEQQLALEQDIERAGGYVSSYLPDDTWLVIGNDRVAQVARAAPLVHWVGAYTPSMKIDPEWKALLDMHPDLLQGHLDDGHGTMDTTAATVRLIQGIQTQPCAVKYSNSTKTCLGIAVVFPHTMEVDATSTASRFIHRARPSTAAVADWRAALERAFHGAVSIAPHGHHQVTVTTPVAHLASALSWLSDQPSVHWVSPRWKLTQHNFEASAIIQSGQSAGNKALDDAGIRPMWAAGITGRNQVVGMGDSGIDFNHCFFVDPTINLNADSSWTIDSTYGFPVFNSTRHRKIRLYYAFTGDRRDSNGHGTHTAGSAVGAPLNSGNQYEGMAPEAKIAFWDLGRGGVDTIVPPADLSSDYYPVSYSVGARVHSDSWGSSSIAYDELAAQVDFFSWAHPDFLPLFAAGNDGNTRTVGGRISGERTVTSPGTAKNTITVGATDSLFSSAAPDMTKYAVYDMTSTKASGGRPYTVRVVQATFGGSVSSLGSKGYRLVVADPLQACMPITNGASLQGAVALLQRGGNCNFDVKVMYVQQAGAAAALVFDNAPGAYFKLGSDGTTNPTIPAMAIPRRVGQTFFDLLEAGEQLTVTFANAKMPANTFDNLAAYSSQGPTPDGRIKPDIVAPGTTQSSHIGSSGCGTQIMQGTSMATPVVAGAAVLVRQYFVEGYYPSGRADGGNALAPSAALVKAMLLGGATALTGFEADTGLPIDPPPSTRQGFGRVLLRDTLPVNVGSQSSSPRLQIVDSAPIKQGETHRYCVSARGGRFTVVLVWTDYPASSSSGSNLVNDLDLIVRASGLNGSMLLGNGGGFGDGADRVNNVEQVDVPDMLAGDVSIEVTGYRLPMGKASPQPYALVVLGSFEGVLVSQYNPAAKGVSARECSVGAVTITSGPQGLTNAKPVAFSFKTAQGGTNSLECQLSTANGSTSAPGTKGWSDCSGGSVEYKDVPDGNYLFQVRIKGSSSSSARTFVLDTTPPQVTLRAQPQPLGAQAVALTDWGASDQSGVWFSCKLDVVGRASDQGNVYDGRGNTVTLGQWQRNCTAPQSFHWLLPGNWTLSINATDDAGNYASTPDTTSWRVVFEPSTQYVRFTGGAYGVSNRNSTRFSFRTLTADSSGRVSSQPASTECGFTSVNASVDMTSNSFDPSALDVSWEACSGNFSRSNMADGNYLMMARVQQPSSGRRLLATPAETYALSQFTIDTTPPTVNISSAPPLYTSRSSAEFVFSADDANATFACALLPGTTPTPPGNGTAGSGNFTVCTSPLTYPALADGWYTWWLGATDMAGNTAPPTNRTFLVDTKPPAVTLQCPGATQATSFAISWNANDGNGSGIASTQCKFYPVALKNGTTGSADSVSWAPCASPLNYTNMAEGRYGFQLQVADRANVSSTAVPCAIAVDNTPPNTTISSGPNKNDLQPPQVTFTLVADDGAYGSNVTLYQCQLNKISDAEYQQLRGGSPTTDIQLASTSWFNCSSTTVVDQTQLSTGNWAFRARAVDNAGNVGVPTSVYVFRVDSSIPIPSAVQATSSSSSLSLPLIIGIAVGAAALLFLLVILLYSCCIRRRRAVPAAATAYPVGGTYPTQQPDPALEAAIAASLMDAQASGTIPPPAQGGMPPAGMAAGLPAGYPPAGGYPPGAVNNPMVNPMVNPAAAAYVVPPAAVPRDVEDAALEAAIQASLSEQGPPAGLAPPAAGEDDEVYRQAVQASLQERYMQARARQQEEASLLTEWAPAAAVGVEEEQDPELRAAIAASLAEQEQRQGSGPVVAPAQGASAPPAYHNMYPPPPPM